METKWRERFVLPVEKSFLKNKSTRKYLWTLRKSFNFCVCDDCVEKYVCVIDIFGENRNKVRQFILFMTALAKNKKKGEISLPRIFFVPTSDVQMMMMMVEYAVFSRMIDNIDRGMKEEEILKDEVDDCFTSDCLRLFFTVISDCFVFRLKLTEKCKCNDICFDHCICSANYVTTARSFYFESIESDKLLASYEPTRKEKLNEIISCM